MRTFPSAKRIAELTEQDLRACALGYRAKNLLATASLISSGKADLERWKEFPDDSLRASLCELPGVGAKVANCVMLFAYERLRAFPIDVWIERVLRQKYFPGKRKVTAAQLRAFCEAYFGEHGGYAQQYLFHHARTGAVRRARWRNESGAQVVRPGDVRYYSKRLEIREDAPLRIRRNDGHKQKSAESWRWAILISFFLHFVVAFSLAAFGGAMSPSFPLEDKPVELTIVDLSATPPPLVPKDPPFMETAKSKESAEKPKEQTFESNANSIAASKLPATGEAPLPSQEGKDRPAVNLETHDYSLQTDGSKPQPEPQSTIAPESKPAPATTTPPKTEVSEEPYPRQSGARHHARARTVRHVKIHPAAANQGAGRNRALSRAGYGSARCPTGPEAETRVGRVRIIRRKKRKPALLAG